MSIIDTIIKSDIPDTAKRQLLRDMNEEEPDNGFRITINVQFEYAMPVEIRSQAPSRLMYFINAAIREYQMAENAKPTVSPYASKTIMNVAYMDMTDIEYCDKWGEGWGDESE